MKGTHSAQLDNISIDNETLSVVLPVKNLKGEVVYAFLPDVPEVYVYPAIPIFEHIYGESTRKGYPGDVFIRDYKHYIDEAARINSKSYGETKQEQLEAYKRIKDNFNQFLMMTLTGSSIVSPKENKIYQYPAYQEKISEREKEKIEGRLVFFYALGRYGNLDPREVVRLGYGWYSSVTEYMKYLMTFYSKEKTSENTEETNTKKQKQ